MILMEPLSDGISIIRLLRSSVSFLPLVHLCSHFLLVCITRPKRCANGEAMAPQYQYCYYRQSIDGEQTALKIAIGENGRQLTPTRTIPNVDFNTAYRLCTWFGTL
jgi:hypothetical protein